MRWLVICNNYLRSKETAGEANGRIYIFHLLPAFGDFWDLGAARPLHMIDFNLALDFVDLQTALMQFRNYQYQTRPQKSVFSSIIQSRVN